MLGRTVGVWMGCWHSDIARMAALSAEFCALIPLHGSRSIATEADLSANMSKLKVLRGMMDMCEGVQVGARWRGTVVLTASDARR